MSNTLKVDEIKKMLTDSGVTFDEKMKKEELLRLLEETNQAEVKEDTASIENSEQEQEEKSHKKYVVVHDFKDLKDNNHIYIKGDPYPRASNQKVTAARIKELSSTKNKMKKVLIKEQV
ncbi:HeH/LEM domain-containing protein [Metabacillus niabensis]|uniref:Exoribonuclease R n=1 Tax=Metabacillus niabensis TaxID=324854 RepID=A0ABT9Z9A9_9BACI|nr:HeH/LEM domain-containing protein [Metabacillus niabensis]MDQ0228411.1 exoribonuclease R [Metabacillus niabensis]